MKKRAYIFWLLAIPFLPVVCGYAMAETGEGGTDPKWVYCNTKCIEGCSPGVCDRSTIEIDCSERPCTCSYGCILFSDSEPKHVTEPEPEACMVETFSVIDAGFTEAASGGVSPQDIADHCAIRCAKKCWASGCMYSNGTDNGDGTVTCRMRCWPKYL